MPFSEPLKKRVRERGHLRCCICHAFSVEIHHIVPQTEDGPDTEENAAPLCPSCHENWGGNPQKRKLIREARDLWFRLCESSMEPISAELKQIREVVEETRRDVKRLAFRNKTYVLGARALGAETSSTGVSSASRYSFVREEFVHPLIVRELIGWLSDSSETIIAVDLTSANNSNRFSGEFTVSAQGGRKAVRWENWENNDRQSFVYEHIAASPSGVQMVVCYDCGGGSGVFSRVGLFSFEVDSAFQPEESSFSRRREVLKILGTVSLGDRYSGDLRCEDGFLLVGPDVGWFQRGEEASKKVPIL